MVLLLMPFSRDNIPADPRTGLPDFGADLRWLSINCPEEYAKLPPEALNDPDLIQMHVGARKPEGEWHWVVIFISRGTLDQPDPEQVQSFEIELSVPLPEDDEGSSCRHHTLKVSRPLCPVCST